MRYYYNYRFMFALKMFIFYNNFKVFFFILTFEIKMDIYIYYTCDLCECKCSLRIDALFLKIPNYS